MQTEPISKITNEKKDKALVTKNEKAPSKIILIYKHATTNLTCTNISSKQIDTYKIIFYF